MMDKLQTRPQVAVVIGAGDATGGAIARRFAEEGLTLVATRRNQEALQPLVESIQGAGGTAFPLSHARPPAECLGGHSYRQAIPTNRKRKAL